jgi:hypothetical protein
LVFIWADATVRLVLMDKDQDDDERKEKEKLKWDVGRVYVALRLGAGICTKALVR